MVQNHRCCGFIHLATVIIALVEQPGVLACLSRRRSRVQIPSRALSTNMARYANRQSGQAQTLVTAGSTPACATGGHASAGHRGAQRDCKYAVHLAAAVQVQLLPDALKHGPFVYRHKDTSPSSWRGRVQFPHGLLNMTKWRNWQTRDAQNVVPFTGHWEFDSPLGH